VAPLFAFLKPLGALAAPGKDAELDRRVVVLQVVRASLSHVRKHPMKCPPPVFFCLLFWPNGAQRVETVEGKGDPMRLAGWPQMLWHSSKWNTRNMRVAVRISRRNRLLCTLIRTVPRLPCMCVPFFQVLQLVKHAIDVKKAQTHLTTRVRAEVQAVAKKQFHALRVVSHRQVQVDTSPGSSD